MKASPIVPSEVVECTNHVLALRHELLKKYDARCVWMAILTAGGGLGDVLYRAGIYDASRMTEMMMAPLIVALQGPVDGKVEIVDATGPSKDDKVN
jgi:hypothetical protein